jgi:hypothetical protein
MKRFATALLMPAGALLVVAALVLGLPWVIAQRGGKPLPPESPAYGKTLAEWQKLYWTWALGGDQGDTVGNVRFHPRHSGPASELIFDDDGFPFLVSKFELTIKPGTAFVCPVLAPKGETYGEHVPHDDPRHLPLEFFSEAEVLVTLDGQPILDSRADDLMRYFFGPVYCDEPLFYDAPQARPGGVHAAGAIFVKGIGFVYPPLPRGEHVLKLYFKPRLSANPGIIATYRITVEPSLLNSGTPGPSRWHRGSRGQRAGRLG